MHGYNFCLFTDYESANCELVNDVSHIEIGIVEEDMLILNLESTGRVKSRRKKSLHQTCLDKSASLTD